MFDPQPRNNFVLHFVTQSGRTASVNIPFADVDKEADAARDGMYAIIDNPAAYVQTAQSAGRPLSAVAANLVRTVRTPIALPA